MTNKTQASRLNASFVRTAKAKSATEPATYGDGRGGHGLTLVVTPRARGGLAKSWKQRVQVKGGKQLNLGLGTYPAVSLAKAREKAAANAILAAAGIDPRDSGKDIPTFGVAAKTFFNINYEGKSESRRRTVWGFIKNHAFPILEHKQIDEIRSNHIGDMLDPIWVNKNPTARQILGILRRFFAWYKRDHPDMQSPIPTDFEDGMPNVQHEVQHHPALPYYRVVKAIDAIRKSEADIATRLGLITGAYTGCRPGEIRKSEWSEIRWREIRSQEDWDDDDGWEEVDWDRLEANAHKTIVWFIPSGHTKKRRPHRVPVSSLHLELLKEAREISGPKRDPSLIFPSLNGGTLNKYTIGKAFNKLGLKAVSYGFRSTFREWCSRAGVPFEVAELALAHKLPPVVAAYVRGDLLENRVTLMQAWSDLLEGKLPLDWKWTSTDEELVKKIDILIAQLQRADERETQLLRRAEKAEARADDMEAANEILRQKKETRGQRKLPFPDWR